MKIAIIGAGGAGLSAVRHCLDAGIPFDIFEQTGSIGGTWNYTEQTGFDENGIAIHTSMYKGLRTNVPKELMRLEEYAYPEQELSYVYQKDVLEYLHQYANVYNLKQLIKFYTQVVSVEPEEGRWSIEVKDVKTKQQKCFTYDAVIVCNGHFCDAFIPEIPGLVTFTGTVDHSHNYRVPDRFKGRRVLLVGSGASAIDISQQVVSVASKTFISHREPEKLPINNGIEQKPVVMRCEGNSVIFVDNSKEEIDEILFCTGYNYKYPFLSEKCLVKVTDNFVHPLYKQIISIEHPTLALIGIPFKVCPFPLFGIQVRFFLATLTGHFKLPTRADMLKELDSWIQSRSHLPLQKYHRLSEAQGPYFDELAETANIKRVPPVVNSLYNRVRMKRNLEECFRIIDDESWEQIK